MGSPAALTITPTAQDFGSATVGGAGAMMGTFTVKNTGGQASGMLMVSISGDFKIAMNGCMAALKGGETCPVTVTFNPTVAGNRMGSLTASATPGGSVSAALTGQGNGAGVLTANPTMLSFPDTLMGATSATRSVQITNTGGSTVTLMTPTIAGMDFAIAPMGNKCGMTLAPMVSCQIDVVFKPTAAGDLSSSLTVAAMGANTVSVGLNGKALGPAKLSIAPAMTAFPNTDVGAQSAERTFVISNTGGAASSAIMVDTAGMNKDQFLITDPGTCAPGLAGGASCQVKVVFKPTSAGMKTATLTATAMTGGMAMATITGNGGVPPVTGLSVSPASFNFGTIALMTTTPDQTFTITNTGNMDTAMFSPPMFAGVSASQFAVGMNTCNAALKPMATCTITVHFSPTTMGDKTAQLVVTAGTVTGKADLTGSGVFGVIGVAGPAGMPMPFTSVVVGQKGNAVTYTVTNMGMVNTGMLAVTIDGPNKDQFSIVEGSNNCTTLAPALTCTFQVVFAPTMAGIPMANVTVSSPASGNGVTSLLGAVGVGQLDIVNGMVPPPLVFGNTTVGKMSPAQMVTVNVRNNFATVTPSVMGDFMVTSNTCAGMDFSTVQPQTMGRWTTCILSVVFSPMEPRGAKTGTLTVTGTGGVTATFALSGTAVGPLQVTPSPLDFTTVPVGAASAPQIITVTNYGTADLTAVTAALSGANAGEFLITNNGCAAAGTITAGNNCMITVVAMASSAGAKMATITVNGTIGTTAETATSNIVANAQTGLLISVTPMAVALGNVPLGGTGTATVTVANMTAAGTGPNSGTITITNVANASVGTPGVPANQEFNVPAAGNNCVGGMSSLAPGQSCTFQVALTPKILNGLGPRTGGLTVSTPNLGMQTVSLTGVAVQSLSSPMATDFGNGVVNDLAGGPTKDITISNTGAAVANPTVTIANGSGVNQTPADFKVVTNNCATSIPAASGATPGTCTITLRFVPGMARPESAQLQVVDGTGFLVTTTNLTGVGVNDATLAFQHISANQTREFGDVKLNAASAPQIFTVQNTGGAPTTAIAFSFPTGSQFAVAPGTTCVSGTTILAAAGTAGDRCDIAVTFTPTAAGADTKTLVVNAVNKLGAGINTPTITLNGRGVAASGAGAIYATPSSPIDLGQVAPGAMGSMITITVTNNSAANITLASPALDNGGNAQFVLAPSATNGCNNGAVVNAAGGSCSFTAQFVPGNVAPGFVVGILQLKSDAASGPVFIGVLARVKHAAVLSIAAPAQQGAFGDVLVNSMSPDQTWTITNTGESPSGVIGIQNTDTANFTATGSCNTASLAMGGTCSVIVHANPTAFGAANATITISGTGLEGSPVTIASVSARGVTAASLTSTAPSLDFGTTNQLGNPVTQMVTIQNRFNMMNVQNSGPLTVSLSNTTDYAVTGCATEQVNGLQGGAQCTLTITYHPTTVGATSATLTVSGTPGGMASVTIGGTSVPSLTIDNLTHTFNHNDIFTFKVTMLPANINPTASGPLKVALGGTDAGQFIVTADTCTGASISLNQKCTVDVKFTGMGAKTATLTVSGSTAGNSIVSTLTGQ